MSEALLKVESLHKSFPVGKGKMVPAVNGVSFQVPEGKCVGIVGESGCGKSTIARLVTGQVSCDFGSMVLDGEEINGFSRNELRDVYKKIQMVFQDPYSVFSPRTRIGTFLEDGLVYHKIMDRKQAHQEAIRLMGLVDLDPSLMERFPHQLSGGQLQRVVIARAISIKPKLIILDEATSALDASVQKQILKLLVRLQSEYNLTYLFIGHDLAVVRSITDQILVMYAGHILEKLESADLEEALHPYTRNLLNSVFSMHNHENKDIRQETEGLEDAGQEQKGCPYRKRCPKTRQKCQESMPDWTEVKTGHEIRCWSKDVSMSRYDVSGK